jgi:hemerythrin-like domain-containing protein
MDAISMLKEDHRTVERLFKRFENAGERAYAEKRKVADRIIEELATHAAIEEQIFYPVVRGTVPRTEDNVLESLEEHHIVKWVLSELDAMDPTDERFDAKMTVLIENVRHHVEEEEQELFAKVREELDRKTLADVGEAMESAKKVAPTHPHPRSPDTPPGNIVMGLTAGLADRIGDTVSGVAQGSVTAAQDLIARILRRQRRAAAPTGSRSARTTAKSVRDAAASAADDLIAAADKAKEAATAAGTGARDTGQVAVREAKETVRAARSGAKGTATSARRSAKRTGTTAKRAATTTRRKATKGAKKSAAAARKAASRTQEAAASGA